MRESDKQTGGDEATIVLHALVGTATWLLLLVLLSHLWCLTSHLSGTCQRSVNLTCSHSHIPISIAPLSNLNLSKQREIQRGVEIFFLPMVESSQCFSSSSSFSDGIAGKRTQCKRLGLGFCVLGEVCYIQGG